MGGPFAPSAPNYDSNRGYFYIEFYVDGVKDKVLMSNFKKIRIENQIGKHYPIVYLEFNIDNREFIENNVYPQREIALYIYYSDEDNKIFTQPIIFKLLVLEMNVDLPQKYIDGISYRRTPERRKTVITCVPKLCHEMMNTTVNRMWEEPVTVSGAVLSVIDELKFPAKIVDIRKINTKLLEQLLVPPMSFHNFLRYMDQKYGVYDGNMFHYVNYNGTFQMWELKRKFDDFIPDGGIYTVHKMPILSKGDATYIEPAKLARKTDNNYVTYDNMFTVCKPTDSLIPGGGKQLHIFHPTWDISKLVDVDPIDNADKYGVHSKKHDMKVVNNTLKKRIRVFDHNLGDENSKTYDISIAANYTKPAFDMNYIQFKLYRKIKPHIVMKIGQPFKLKVYAEAEKYKDSSYEGSYLITSSILTLSRTVDSGHDTVFAECEIMAVRTSQSNI